LLLGVYVGRTVGLPVTNRRKLILSFRKICIDNFCLLALEMEIRKKEEITEKKYTEEGEK
jgi:hypothetical protein